MILRLLESYDLQGSLQTLREVVADPASNLTLAVLMLGFVSLALLIIVVSLLLFIDTSDDDDDADLNDEDHPDTPVGPGTVEVERVADTDSTGVHETTAESRDSRTPASRRVKRVAGAAGLAAILLLAFAALTSTYVITSQNDYCVRCHSPAAHDSGTAKGSSGPESGLTELHAGVKCVACHEGPITDVVGTTVDRVRHVAAYVAGRRGGQFAAVASDRCLACHEPIMSGVSVDQRRGLRTSHREPVEAGMQCRTCHPNAGHLPKAKGAGMSACVRCHDGKIASADCATCHTKDTASAASEDRVFAPSRLVGKGDCSGCHQQKSCDSCHGLRMPHDIAFREGGHARVAGFEKKRSCFRCHAENECGKCHTINVGGTWGHGESWKSIHMKVTPGTTAGCGCHGRNSYVQQGKDYCLACHEPGIR